MPYNVWIVDDEPIIRFGLASCVDWASEGLALAGEAANGQAALALLEERGFDADILITDIKMPLMDGIELIRRVKARRPNVKAVLVSSYSDFEYAREAVKLGVVVDYLLKPTMEPADLVRMLRACKERLEEDRLRHAKEAWIATEERHRRMLGFEAKLKAYLDGAAEPSFDWKPEWAQADLTIAVWKQDRTALREGALHRIVALETARDKLNAWCEGRGAALLAGEDELATLLADRGGGAWDDLRAFRQRLEDEEGLRFTVGVSPPFRRFPASLREAYGLASAALEQAFFRGRGACYLGGIPAAATGVDAASAERAERLREQFSKAFASADRDRCEAIFETHAALWTEPRRFARADIVQQARGLLIMMWSHHFRNNTEETMRAMIAKLEAVERAPTLTELTAFVRRELTRLWEPDSLRIVADDAGGAHVIQLALSYIQENYRRDISLQEVADTVHMSKNYFSEQFKRRTGLGFIDFVIRLRIHYAKHLLEHTGMRVHDVGLESGFNSPKHFLKLFKRMAGCTPAEYREKRAKPKEGDD
ncbi:helix-turn-helix domain-containing protein [Paenibacillus sp.]|uniref:helix-turn-helix domain-containing protein n=1 Tax=Paenibacillus sp. TaxID=58172 RepID=UPI002D52C8E3|nr:helix-turn-helix domain-containing protein [Paenibacillus sp.]HZG55014.1 helix-turn-helix domain-containing protein [Paenibacillus sp.]